MDYRDTDDGPRVLAVRIVGIQWLSGIELAYNDLNQEVDHAVESEVGRTEATHLRRLPSP